MSDATKNCTAIKKSIRSLLLARFVGIRGCPVTLVIITKKAEGEGGGGRGNEA